MRNPDSDADLRPMIQLLKHIFDEAVLAGFSQTEAMSLTSQTLQAFLAPAIASQSQKP